MAASLLQDDSSSVFYKMIWGLRRFVNNLLLHCLSSELLESDKNWTGGAEAISFITEKLIRKKGYTSVAKGTSL